jgi:hypothetical protein
MSFIYVRKDLSYMTPESANLLKGFLTALYTDEYTAICGEAFGFVPVTGNLRAQALNQINALNTGGGSPWTFELSTDAGAGQGDNVFSVKRDSFSEIEQDSLVEQLAALQRQVDAMAFNSGASTGIDAGHTHTGTMTDDEEEDDHEAEADFDFKRDEEVTAALALGAVSFSLWVLALICIIVKYVMHI